MVTLPTRTKTSCVALVVPVLLAVLACGRDAATYDAPVALERELTQLFQLGPDGGTWSFRDLRGIAFDSTGRIWVAEYDGVIHQFEEGGRYIRTIKRPGDGPGEFDVILYFDIDPATNNFVLETNEEVIVLDQELEQLARWTRLRKFGVLLSGVRMIPNKGGLLLPLPLKSDTVRKDGFELITSHGLLGRADYDGVVSDTLAPMVGGWTRRKLPPDGWRGGVPGRGREIWIPLGTNGVLVGDGHGEYNLSLVNIEGKTLRRYSRRVPVEELTGFEGPAMTRGMISRAVFDSRREEILLCRVPVDPNSKSLEVDYFSLKGEFLGTLAWPLCPYRTHRDGTIYATGLDENGSPFIRAFTYSTPGAALKRPSS